MTVKAIPVREFDTKKDAQAFADAQRGKVFYRFWTLEEMQKNTLGWQEAYDKEQALGEPRWATRLLEHWKTRPEDFLARDEAPADEVHEHDGKYYVGVALEEETLEAFDSVQKKQVTWTRPKLPSDPEAKRVDGTVFVKADPKADSVDAGSLGR